MFCNKCGRTIKADEAVCQKCGAELGESRFEGSGYTSVQTRFMPGEVEPDDSPYTPYTRTTYTTMDEPEKGDVLTRTTYRPILQEEKNEEAEGAEDAGEDAGPVSVEAEMPPHVIEIEPLKPAVQKGISPSVEEYINRIKSRGTGPFIKRKKRSHAEDDDSADLTTTKVDVDDDDDDDDFAPRKNYGNIGRVLGLGFGSIVILGLLVFGFFRLSSGLAPKSPIEGVTKSVYDDGLVIANSFLENSFRIDMVRKLNNFYASTTENDEFTDKIEEDKARINDLLPDNKQENDEAFVGALLTIQEAVGNALITDYTAQMDSTSEAKRKYSEDAWNTVQQSIARLTAAKDPQELRSIAQTTKVDQPEPEEPIVVASPTSPPYRKLSKGAKNEDVKKMQQRLIELNYLTGQADGDFGSETQTAVKLFQQAIGMQEQDGIATPELQEAMFNPDALRHSPAQPQGQ